MTPSTADYWNRLADRTGTGQPSGASVATVATRLAELEDEHAAATRRSLAAGTPQDRERWLAARDQAEIEMAFWHRVIRPFSPAELGRASHPVEVAAMVAAGRAGDSAGTGHHAPQPPQLNVHEGEAVLQR